MVDVLRNILLLKYVVVFLASTEAVISHSMQKSPSLSNSGAVQCGGTVHYWGLLIQWCALYTVMCTIFRIISVSKYPVVFLVSTGAVISQSMQNMSSLSNSRAHDCEGPYCQLYCIKTEYWLLYTIMEKWHDKLYNICKTIVFESWTRKYIHLL